MDIHSLAPSEVYATLHSSAKGLGGTEPERRREEYGPNLIRPAKKRPFVLKAASQFTHFLAILLFIAAVLCFVSEWLNPGEGMLSLGAAIIGVIIINAVFSSVQEYKAEKAVEALGKLLPSGTKVIRDGEEITIPAEMVVPGDLLVLAEGDKVPADARVVESAGLTVNNASLTGESDARPRDSAPFGGDMLDSPNIVFAGTLVISGNGKAVAYATGMATEFGKIAHLTGTVEPGLTPLQKEIMRATRVVAAIAVTVGVVFFLLGLAVGMTFWHNFLFVIGIIIANVPEGLLPTVTLSLAMGSQRMARKKALIKDLNSVETLGSVSVICTDKTGTLTMNRMEVQKVWTPGGEDAEEMLAAAALLCNNASFRNGEYSGDPTETALLKFAREKAGEVKVKRIFERPFDPDRKMMTTVNEYCGRAVAFTKGAPEAVLSLCGGIFPGGSLDGPARSSILNECSGMMDDGLRVIAFAFSDIGAGKDLDEAVEKDMTFIGIAGLQDPPRPEVPDAVRKCREAGIRVIMVTGDAGRTAEAIASKIGLSGPGAGDIAGHELEGLSDSELGRRLDDGAVIFSRMTPRQKLRVVSVLKDKGERVAVTGDGVNDAPALKRADIGIAMGVAGTDVAREAADMVLMDDNFATIVSAIEEGRTIFENIKKFITYIFAHLTPEAVPYILFSLFKIPLPLTVMQIIAIDLGTETVPALALGVEPPEEGARARNVNGNRIIDAPLLVRSYLFLGLISSLGVLTAYFYVLFGGGWHWGMDLPAGSLLAREAATATFLGIVILQVGTVFACRSSRASLLRLGVFSNRLVIIGIAAELLLSAAIIYTPIGQRLFGTAPVGADVWLVLLPFPFILVAADEVRKRFSRSSLSGNSPAPPPVRRP